MLKPQNCLECPNHSVINDPDPNDWFCDDDVAVVCTKKENDKRDLTSNYFSDRNEYKAITVSCRPYNIKKESDTPEWCPLD